MSAADPRPVGTALIVGHRGQDGVLLADRLRAEGIRVIGVGRPGAPARSDERVVDVTDPAAVDRLVATEEPDEIYYLAAHHGSSESMRPGGTAADIRTSWGVHVTGPKNVLAAVREHRPTARVLLASSCLVHAPGPGRIDEAAPLVPDTVYGATKAAGMLVARERRRRGTAVWTAVLFPHESGFRPPTFAASRVVRMALEVAAGRRDAVAVGDPDAEVDWSLATAVTDGFVRMLRGTEPDDYVLASGEGRTVRELAVAVLTGLGLDPERCLRTDPTLLTRPSARRVGDPSRFGALTGWVGRPDLADFARELVAQHRLVLDRPEDRAPD